MTLPHVRVALAALALAASAARADPAVVLIGLHQADQSVLGAQGDRDSSISAARVLSSDARYACFWSDADNLVAGDTNGLSDVFWRDRQTGATQRVSVATGGAQGDAPSVDCAISADGRFVAFASRADNLAPGITVPNFNVFVHDVQAQTTELVSVGLAGGGGNGTSVAPLISADGRHVAYMSAASNLVAGDNNGVFDVFVRDRQLATTERASLANGGAEANADAYVDDLSADGRYVLFRSGANNLVAGDTNAESDLFVRDRSSGSTLRVSVGAGGVESNGPALAGAISADGRYVAFESHGDNLVAGDTNAENDVFVRDVVAGTTIRASVANDGGQAVGYSFSPTISADGRYVGFISIANALVADDMDDALDAYVRDTVAGTTTRVSVTPGGAGGDRGTFQIALASDGRRVAFQSEATDLVAGDTNDRGDIFVRDLDAASTSRVSLADASGPFRAEANSGSFLPFPSEFASAVSFASSASNLLPGDANSAYDIFVRDPATFAIERASVATGGAGANDNSVGSAISRNGRIVVFESSGDNLAPNDMNKFPDIFVRDRDAGTTVRIDAFGGGDPDGDSGEPALSGDGRYIAFTSSATNLTGPPPGGPPTQYDIYVRDRTTGATVRASVAPNGAAANGDSFAASLSLDGRYIVFTTRASNLAPGDTTVNYKIVRRDLVAGTNTLVTAGASGAAANGSSETAPHAISDDGRFVVFDSEATNLVPGDTNGAIDVFVRDLDLAATARMSVTSAGAQVTSDSLFASISADGRFVLFSSYAHDLSGAATDAYSNAILHDRRTGRSTLVSTDAAHTLGDNNAGNASLSSDGRNLTFDSFSTNWTLDVGSQSPYLDPFLVRLIEPSTASLTAPSPKLPLGQPVAFSVQLAGSDTNPRGGTVTITASTGETCTATQLVETATTVSSASCNLVFATPGPRSVGAAYSGSPNYLSSSATAVGVDVVVDPVFSNGFE